MKDNGTDIWPTPMTTTAGFRNFDAEVILNNEDLTKPQNKRNVNGQDNNDIIMLPERLFPDPMDQEFDDKWTFENDDEQFDPIETLLVHEPKSLHNHFSKVTAATSVKNVMTVNVINMDLQKRKVMAHDMDITVSNMIKRKKLEIWKDELEDWLIGILRLPSQNTAPTDCNIVQHSITIQILNEKQARQGLFVSERPNRYTAVNTDNQDRTLLPSKTIIRTTDEKNVFDALTRGTLSPWNLLTAWKGGNNLLFYTTDFDLVIHPEPLEMSLFKSFCSAMVVKDHGSTKGVILGILGNPEHYNDGTTILDTLSKRHELSDKSTFDQRTHPTSHKSEQLLGFTLTTKMALRPQKNGTMKQITKQVGLFKKSKKPSIFRNLHPEFSNHWKSCLTFHASILSTFKKDVLRMENDVDDSQKSILTTGNITI
jgi:hypothetical protein